MKPIRFVAFAAVLVLTCCAHRTPQATVDLIDTSLSITRRAEHAALTAVGDQISRMRRGDVLIVIPITGDAENDAGGRILRLQAPTVREPYDADLRRFQVEARRRYVAWEASLDTCQCCTDIIGSLDAARQELAMLPQSSIRRLIFVSDFLEDDGAYNFVRDTALANPTRARHLASRLRVERGFSLTDVSLCLGRLESSDFAPLSEERKAAIRAFWTAYLAQQGRTPDIDLDGIGLLAGSESACSTRAASGALEATR